MEKKIMESATGPDAVRPEGPQPWNIPAAELRIFSPKSGQWQ
jgi:hypothetical protein